MIMQRKHQNHENQNKGLNMTGYYCEKCGKDCDEVELAQIARDYGIEILAIPPLCEDCFEKSIK